ncbi:secondary thiamine-phosphate synthase enzyme YjbQ [Oceanidesulfovibrio marinus]|uniref:YjbQ family protein n=1 Tax=Oceanidesulfovibrio marinus TaxID=370038 RepID=A0A6P1ZEQ6_9BACT|nr:secondary thiamine-phosphate synthase enzyme YjbQ [Oceanidesulfovibrio marinus]QJT09313.1 YjbQ family protein [Oceanidesulfovibrio marinus]TVM32807.1 YjbQ family protein [Oceanidesulfovibrio marinus]
MQQIDVKTGSREELVDITDKVQRIVAESGLEEGALLLFCAHTTAALTVNENADPSVMRDIVVNMATLVPHSGDYRHAEGNSDAHIKSSLFGPSLLLVVSRGQVVLGTWQGVYFCEFDGPRSRKVWAQLLPAA